MKKGRRKDHTWEQRYLNGERYSEIAKDYDCCQQTISYHIKQSIKKGVIHDVTA